MNMDSIYDKNWNDIFTKAAIQRLKPATPGPDAICTSRSVFNDLMKVLEEANRLDAFSIATDEIQFKKTDKGFVCDMGNSYVQVKCSGRTLLEALSMSLRDWDRKVNKCIQ
jgi:hypothetical protein